MLNIVEGAGLRRARSQSSISAAGLSAVVSSTHLKFFLSQIRPCAFAAATSETSGKTSTTWKGVQLSPSRNLPAAVFEPLCAWFENAFSGETARILRFSRDQGTPTFYIGSIGLRGCEPWNELRRLRTWVSDVVMSE